VPRFVIRDDLPVMLGEDQPTRVPRMILSSASEKSRGVICWRLLRAACSADSLTRFASPHRRSPASLARRVQVHIRREREPRAWIFRIASRPFRSGRPTVT